MKAHLYRVRSLMGMPLLPAGRIPLDGVRAVGIDRVTGPKDRVTYRVTAKGPSPVELWSGSDLLRARRFAEQVATDHALPLHDASTGRFRSRDPEELELSFGERLRREGTAPALPSLPDGSTLRWWPGTESVVEFPGQRLSPFIVLLWFAFPAFFLTAFWFVATPRTGPMFVLLSLLLVVPCVWAIVSAKRPKFVRIDPDGVEVRRLGRRRRIAFTDLEELVLTPERLHLLSDEAHEVVAAWTDSPEDLRFVSRLIEHAAYASTPGARTSGTDAPRGAEGDDAPVRAAPGGPLTARPAPDAPSRPPRRRRGSDRVPVLVGGVFLLVGFGLLGGAGFAGLRVRDFEARAAVSIGTVVHLERSSSVYRPVVRFLHPSGRQVVVTGAMGSNPPSYSIGEEVEVRYLPENPRDARVGSRRSLWAVTAILAGFGTVFALAGAMALATYRSGLRRP